METFSALLALCAGNSTVTGVFPTQRPVMQSFDVSFDLRLNKRLSKQSWGWWFERPSCPLWHHCNVYGIGVLMVGVMMGEHGNAIVIWSFLDKIHPVACLSGIYGMYCILWVKKFDLISEFVIDVCNCAMYIIFFFSPTSTKLKGGYAGFASSVRPSVRLSFHPSVDVFVSALYLQ